MKKFSRQIEDILATVAGNKWSVIPKSALADAEFVRLREVQSDAP